MRRPQARKVLLPVIGLGFGPLTRFADKEWQGVGAVDAFEIGEMVMVTCPEAAPLVWSGQVGENTACLQRRGAGEFVAYCHSCTHLGCPVFWFPDARLFMFPVMVRSSMKTVRLLLSRPRSRWCVLRCG